MLHQKNVQTNGDSVSEPCAMVTADESGEEVEDGGTNENSAEEQQQQQHTDYFYGTGYCTNNTLFIEEEKVNKLKNNVQATQALIECTAGKVISRPIGDRDDIAIKCSIVGCLLEKKHIKGLASDSYSIRDPKHFRFSLNIHGTNQTLLDSQPASYYIAVTDYGKDKLEQLCDAIVDSDNKLGADGSRGKLYVMGWKEAPKVHDIKVGDDDNKTGDAALILGEHCDQSTSNDKDHYTPRNINAFGAEFHLDLTLFVMWNDDDGKEREHRICTVSQRMEGNVSYYLSHWGSGRGAIAQTTYNGRRAVLVLKHRVWLSDKNKSQPRAIVVCDPVFPTKAAHDDYLKKVESRLLPRRHDSKLKTLFREIVESNPALALEDYRKNLASNIRNTIETHVPHPCDYVVQCCNNDCGNNASVLNLEQIEGRDDGLSGAALHEYLQKHRDNDALAEHRLLCEGCAAAISEELLVKKLCLKCCVRSTVSDLARCGVCREYTCIGYKDNGERKYSCVQGGVLLDESNIYNGKTAGYGAICKSCFKSKNNVRISVRKESKEREERRNAKGKGSERLREQLLAIYQLKDPEYRENVDKKYLRGETQINWKNACDEADGYGALAGGDKITLKNFFRDWRAKAGKKYDTLQKFEAYEGKVGLANCGRRS